jgi:hypothetical protein
MSFGRSPLFHTLDGCDSSTELLGLKSSLSFSNMEWEWHNSSYGLLMKNRGCWDFLELPKKTPFSLNGPQEFGKARPCCSWPVIMDATRPWSPILHTWLLGTSFLHGAPTKPTPHSPVLIHQQHGLPWSFKEARRWELGIQEKKCVQLRCHICSRNSPKVCAKLSCPTLVLTHM